MLAMSRTADAARSAGIPASAQLGHVLGTDTSKTPPNPGDYREQPDLGKIENHRCFGW
jgi:hypothetical protein